jgi:hypothetical protein
VQVPCCSWQSKALDEAPYKLSGAVAKLASITFWNIGFSYWIDIPWFRTEGKLAAIFIKPSLGVPNWPVIYFINYTPTSSLALFIIASSAPIPDHVPPSCRFCIFSSTQFESLYFSYIAPIAAAIHRSSIPKPQSIKDTDTLSYDDGTEQGQ